MSRNYFKYLFTKGKVPVLFFMILYTGILIAVASQYRSVDPYVSMALMHIDGLKNVQTTGMVMSLCGTYILPVVLFSFVHRRRSADTYFALGISRRQMLITSLIFSFVICWGMFSIGTLFTFFMLGGQGLTQYLTGIVAAVIPLVSMLVINSVIYLLANNIFDGIVMTAAYNCLSILVSITLSVFLGNVVAGYSNAYGLSGMLAEYISPVFLSFSLWMSGIDSESMPFIMNKAVVLIIMAAAAVYGLKKQFVQRKTERADQLSTEIFAYPFIIYIYLLLILLALGSSLVKGTSISEIIILYLVLLVCYVVSVFIYRRKIELSWKQPVIFIGSALCAIVIAMAGWSTRGFGIADTMLLLNRNKIVYTYWAQITQTNGEIRLTDIDQDKQDYLVITIDANKKSEPGYEDALALMEKCRKECVDNWYDKDQNSDYYWYLSLNISEQENNQSTTKFYFNPTELFTMEDLKTINQLSGAVQIETYEGELISLDAYLHK